MYGIFPKLFTNWLCDTKLSDSKYSQSDNSKTYEIKKTNFVYNLRDGHFRPQHDVIQATQINNFVKAGRTACIRL